IAAAAALVGSSPGGSNVMPTTTLSFLLCAEAGATTATSAARAMMDNCRNIVCFSRTEPNYASKLIGYKGLVFHCGQRRQRHHALRLVTGCRMLRREGAQDGGDVAALRISQGAARRVGAAGRNDRLRR